MAYLGVHFALTDEDTEKLCALEIEEERLAFLQEEIEECYMTEFAVYAAESDKAWDAIHRLLTDGYLSCDGRHYPLDHVILGGKQLYEENDYIMSLKTPEQVQDIATVLEEMTESEFRARYNAIPADDYDGELDEDDFLYTWEWFQNVRELYLRAAGEGRYVLFTVDQ